MNAQITYQCDVCRESVDKVDSTAEKSQSVAFVIWFVVIPAEAAAVAEALLTE